MNEHEKYYTFDLIWANAKRRGWWRKRLSAHVYFTRCFSFSSISSTPNYFILTRTTRQMAVSCVRSIRTRKTDPIIFRVAFFMRVKLKKKKKWEGKELKQTHKRSNQCDVNSRVLICYYYLLIAELDSKLRTHTHTHTAHRWCLTRNCCTRLSHFTFVRARLTASLDCVPNCQQLNTSEARRNLINIFKHSYKYLLDFCVFRSTSHLDELQSFSSSNFQFQIADRLGTTFFSLSLTLFHFSVIIFFAAAAAAATYFCWLCSLGLFSSMLFTISFRNTWSPRLLAFKKYQYFYWFLFLVIFVVPVFFLLLLLLLLLSCACKFFVITTVWPSSPPNDFAK